MRDSWLGLRPRQLSRDISRDRNLDLARNQIVKYDEFRRSGTVITGYDKITDFHLKKVTFAMKG